MCRLEYFLFSPLVTFASDFNFFTNCFRYKLMVLTAGDCLTDVGGTLYRTNLRCNRFCFYSLLIFCFRCVRLQRLVNCCVQSTALFCRHYLLSTSAEPKTYLAPIISSLGNVQLSQPAWWNLIVQLPSLPTFPTQEDTAVVGRRCGRASRLMRVMLGCSAGSRPVNR